MREALRGEVGAEAEGPFLPVDHRHCIFTLPPVVWELIRQDLGTLVDDMFEAAKRVIERLFEDRFRHMRVRPGMICVVHFTGRDLKWNPHIHMIVTEGGLTQWGEWKKHTYWPYAKMASYWKYEVLNRLRFHLRGSLDAKAAIDRQWTMSFKDGTEGYVVKYYRDLKDVKGIGSYLARYVRHPPIGESRILGFDERRVRIKYEWDNEIHETIITTERFIEAMLSNIPPKWFQMVRWYGIYSNTMHGRAMARLQAARVVATTLDEFMHGPPTMKVLCPTCGGVMEPTVMEYVRYGRWQMKVY